MNIFKLIYFLFLFPYFIYSTYIGFHPKLNHYNVTLKNEKYKLSRTIEYEHSPYDYDIVNYPYYHVVENNKMILRNCSKNTSRTSAINN